MKKHFTHFTLSRWVLLVVFGWMSLQTQAQDVPTIVTQKPQGQEVTSVLQGYTEYRSTRSVAKRTLKGAASSYVIGADGALYLHNVIYGLPTDCWLRLPKTADNEWEFKGKVAYPTTTGETTDKSFITRINVLYDEENYDYQMIPSTNDANGTLVFTLADGVVTMEQAPDVEGYGFPSYGLGLVSESGEYKKYYAANLRYTPFTDTPTMLPSDAVSQPFQVYFVSDFSEETVLLTPAYLTDDAVYLRDPLGSSQWIKGTISGNKVVFTMQYMGTTASPFAYHRYLMPSHYTVHQVDGGVVRTYEQVEQVEADYDVATHSITFHEPDALTYIENKDAKVQYESFCRPELKPYAEKLVKPVAPVWEEYNTEDESAPYAYFYLMNFGEDHTYIDPAHLTYELFYNKNTTPVTFEPGTYSYLNEPMTQVPYTFKDTELGYDFVASETSFDHAVYTYGSPIPTTVGVRLTYTLNGESLSSDIVWSDGTTTTTSVRGVTTSGTVREEWFDLMGRRLAAPRSRVVLHRSVGSDGKVRVTKVVK